MEPRPPDPTSPFDELSTPHRVSDDRYVASVPDGWQQGRGAFGGLVIALLARSAEASVTVAGRTLRSVTAQLCGPTEPGPVELGVERLRETKNVTTISVRLVQSGVIQAHAVCILGSARATSRELTWIEPPRIPPWQQIRPLGATPLAPAFSRYFEYRLAEAPCGCATQHTRLASPPPASGVAEPIVQGWIRPRSPGVRRDAAFLAACVDAWFPSFFACEPARPVGTISFTLDLVGSTEGLDPTTPLAYRARTLSVREGWAVELRELWSESGRLLALNHQTFVIIR